MCRIGISDFLFCFALPCSSLFNITVSEYFVIVVIYHYRWNWYSRYGSYVSLFSACLEGAHARHSDKQTRFFISFISLLVALVPKFARWRTEFMIFAFVMKILDSYPGTRWHSINNCHRVHGKNLLKPRMFPFYSVVAFVTQYGEDKHKK